jgi:hypothetical protein
MDLLNSKYPTRLILFVIFTAIANIVHAQKQADLIYKVDRSSFAAIVDEIGEGEITYFLPTDAAKRSPQRISRSQVWKIVYANGDLEIISSPDTNNPSSSADIVFLKNKETLSGKVLRITNDKIEYLKKDDGPIYELDRKEVVKIEYGDGKVEVFSRKIASKAKTHIEPDQIILNNNSVVKGEIIHEDSRTVGYILKENGTINELNRQEISKINYGSKKEKRFLLLKAKEKPTNIKKEEITTTPSKIKVGAGGSYLSLIADSPWMLLGMKSGIGGKIQLTYSINNSFALVTGTSYNRWMVKRNLLDEDQNLVATTDISLSSIPFRAGIKYSPFMKLYVLPSIIYNFQAVSIKSTLLGNSIQKGTSLGFGLSIGKEIKLGPISTDLSVFYESIQSVKAKEQLKTTTTSYIGLSLLFGLTPNRK